MDCERYRESIHELVDGTLGPIRRAELQQHLDGCPRCAQLANDLRVVRDAAAALEPLPPPDGAWLQIAGRLRQEGRVTAPPAAAAPRWHATMMAIAAALVLAVGVSVYFVARQPAESPAPVIAGTSQPGGNASAQDAVQSIADEIRLAEQHYQNAIARLEDVARLDQASGQQTIDPATAATLQKSLTVIDQAIDESRAALRTEPQSAPARDSLFGALRRKVALLQDTVVLMNEMRKGNSAGAAQVIEGVNKS